MIAFYAVAEDIHEQLFSNAARALSYVERNSRVQSLTDRLICVQDALKQVCKFSSIHELKLTTVVQP